MTRMQPHHVRMTIRFHAAWGGVCALCVAIAAPAAAQQGFDGDRTQDPRRLASSVGMTSGIDTNVFNTADDAKSDVVWTLSPRTSAALHLGAARLTANGSADLVYFQQIASERSVNAEGAIKLTLPLNRVRPFVSTSYLRTRQRPTIEIDARSLRSEQSVAAGATIRVTDTTALDVAATNTKVAFDGDARFYDVPLQDVFNRTTRTVGLSLRHRLTPLTSLSVVAEGADELFERSPARNARSIRVAPEVEFASSALISGKASVGYRSFVARDASMPNFNGVVVSAELSYTLRASTRFTLLANRDIEYSYEVTAPYYLISGVGGEIGQQITDTVGISARAMHYRLDFHGIVGGNGQPGVRPPDNLMSGGLGVLYKIGPGTRLTINADYYHRLSPFFVRQYTGLRAGSAVVYAF